MATMAALVIAGEACFVLPFLIPRIFRPTLLDTLEITNFELGTAMSMYGMVAIVSYFLGGPLADRFSVRALMTFSLLASATGGMWFSTIPSLFELKFLYGFWGASTILLFWAALVRATREWGSNATQGMAFGILDGGRGLFAALLASGGVVVFASVLPTDHASASLAQRAQALAQVIRIFTGFVVAAAVLVWFCVPSRTIPLSSQHKFSLRDAATILANKAVWLQSIIVLCAYVGYKGTDDLVLYARDVFEFDDVSSARLGSTLLWTRPVAALGAGLLADRIGGIRAVVICFFGVLLGNLVIASGAIRPSMPWALYMNVVGTGAMTYGLRGVYYALYREAQVSNEFTGTATGIVSVVGYSPDVFVGPMMGWFTDTWPGALGHRILFAVLAVFGGGGVLATLLFQRVSKTA